MEEGMGERVGVGEGARHREGGRWSVRNSCHVMPAVLLHHACIMHCVALLFITYFLSMAGEMGISLVELQLLTQVLVCRASCSLWLALGVWCSAWNCHEW